MKCVCRSVGNFHYKSCAKAVKMQRSKVLEFFFVDQLNDIFESSSSFRYLYFSLFVDVLLDVWCFSLASRGKW